MKTNIGKEYELVEAETLAGRLRVLQMQMAEHAKHMEKLGSHPASWNLFTKDDLDPNIITPASGLEHLTRDTLYSLILLCHYTAALKGFWGLHAGDNHRNKGEAIALMHSELSECLEATRKGDRENEAEELADTLIRILDYCGGYRINLADALLNKMVKNMHRPHKHGKEF